MSKGWVEKMKLCIEGGGSDGSDRMDDDLDGW